MPVSVAPTAALVAPRAAVPVVVAPLPGDPTCVAFAGGADAFRHAGTRSLAVDLAPSRAPAVDPAAAALAA
ncbi:hypothetical protein AWH51_01845 [Clavibacter tessellarius]|uniref:Uncharacterized protein n=1 Tax=Clavibacter tessellarius TaxID=31965 RepID=A0A154UXW4_9MICO|nr:hypothetical protein AWH51_01845 [Clavibacter michiganensis subsp. tessellarius]